MIKKHSAQGSETLNFQQAPDVTEIRKQLSSMKNWSISRSSVKVTVEVTADCVHLLDPKRTHFHFFWSYALFCF